jgi:hypothetical protein
VFFDNFLWLTTVLPRQYQILILQALAADSGVSVTITGTGFETTEV